MIHQNWEALIKPRPLNVESGINRKRQATIVAEPLERGFGLTLGNALRRVLMSSLQGAAITSVQIEGVLHEFSQIHGVREDVTDIVLNLKDVALRMIVDGPKKLAINANKPGPVTAGDIKTSAGIDILNKDHVICHLDRGASIRMEMTAEVGRGYISADRSRGSEGTIGLIPIDAIYSPVRRVSYRVNPTREGSSPRLRLPYPDNLETDGSISPEDAIAFAARIIQDQLRPFVNFKEPEVVGETDPEDGLGFNPKFLKKVEELELSVRAANCLKNDNIVYLGDLVQKSENDMLRTPNFGRKSLNEIKELLEDMNLHLGMEAPDWPPENIEELAQKA